MRHQHLWLAFKNKLTNVDNIVAIVSLARQLGDQKEAPTHSAASYESDLTHSDHNLCQDDLGDPRPRSDGRLREQRGPGLLQVHPQAHDVPVPGNSRNWRLAIIYRVLTFIIQARGPCVKCHHFFQAKKKYEEFPPKYLSFIAP